MLNRPSFDRYRAFTVTAALLLVFVLYASPASAEEGYKVRKGDNLGSIAHKHGVTVKDILRYNNLSSPDRLQIGQRLVIPPQKGISKTYTVKKGDVLSKIASKYGLRTDDLVVFNNLKGADSLRIGQKLLIPNKSVAPARATHNLSPDVKRQLDKIKILTWKWKNIVVHHSATDRGTAAGMDRYHREERHMENGLAYHFVIGNGRGTGDGVIEIGNRWRRQIKGGHVATTALNEISIGICLIGNFEKQRPTKKQMDSLRALNQYLIRRVGIKRSRVKAHKDINPRPTACPGKLFPTYLL